MTATYRDLIHFLQPNARCYATGADYESIVWGSPDIPQPTKEECEQARESFEAALPMLILREHRDAKLSACDYIGLTDTALTEEKKSEWLAYRQALRDFPSNVSPAPECDEKRTLTNVTWPVPPSK
jgi:hypothetical protein